jgi:hypothetical protein
MDELGPYQIQLRGRVDENEINTMSPLQMTVKERNTVSTLLTVSTDQSGLIGLMRHLHGLGFVFLSVKRES